VALAGFVERLGLSGPERVGPLDPRVIVSLARHRPEQRVVVEPRLALAECVELG